MPEPSLPEELELVDWRRQTAELYGEVRRASTPAEGHAVWRAGRDRMFGTHPQSPLGPGDPLLTSGIPYWPYDRRLRLAVPVTRDTTGAYALPTAPDEITRIRQIGWAELPEPLGGRLAVWWLEQYGGGIFVPFRDATAGDTTYGAGRYLLDTAKGADLGLDRDGALMLDFNFSYHPSCRYDPMWQCPLAPPENVLGVAIEAGERLAAG